MDEISAFQREPCPVSELAVECGGSDATSGLGSNPAAGRFSNRLVDAVGTIILSEPAEFTGAEYILAERAVGPGSSSSRPGAATRSAHRSPRR